jgi:hypothetical protein
MNQSDNKYIMRMGCEILGSLSETAHVAQDIALIGGVEAIVHASRFLRLDENIDELTLSEFADTDIGVSAIVAQGGVPLLMRKLQNHAFPDLEYELMQDTCDALTKVARTKLGRDAIIEADIINYVLFLIRMCVRLPTLTDPYAQTEYSMTQGLKNRLQNTLCGFLMVLSNDKDALKQIIYHNGCTILSDVEQDSCGDAAIEFAVSKILRGVRHYTKCNR